MPQFHFTAFDSAGQRISGQIEAASRDGALRSLSDQGYFPVDAQSVDVNSTLAPSDWRSTFSRRPSSSDITLFTQALSLLLVSGQPLTGALSLIEQDTGTPRIQGLARRLRIAIAGGKSFNEALLQTEAGFPPAYVGMVKAAETSGDLAATLSRIAESREKEQRLRSRFFSALLYPSLLVVLAIATIVLMITVVVPRFRDILGDQAAKLPANTAAVLAVSDFLTTNGVYILSGMALALAVLFYAARQPAGRRALERGLLAMPLAGPIVQLSLTARFCRTLGELLSSGIGLPAALTLTRDVIGNAQARDLIQRIGVALREGRDFTEPLRQSTVFPPLVTSLLRIGGESGSLSQSALKLADMYESKLDVALQRLATLIEPAVILFVSFFIGFIVLSIMGAIVGVYDLTAP